MRRALLATGAAVLLALSGSGTGLAATTEPPPTPDVPCDAQSHPETTQGRVPAADVASGRSKLGYTCNAVAVAHLGTTGGFRVERYVDAAGHECAYFDSTLLFPKDAATGAEGPGTYVVDMSDPTKPVITTTLRTASMQSPHESLRLNQKRGILAADMGYPTANPGVVDLYDVTKDCRAPVLLSSSALGVLGHESGFAPDGNTFYVTSLYGHTMSALDVSDPTLPKPIWVSGDYQPHGVSISADGNRLYMADNDTPNGLTILDVSQVQKRTLNPVVPVVSRLTWDSVSIPQNATPFTVKGHPYVMENDEYASGGKVGAARIIDIADEKHPFVVSNMRLVVNGTDALTGDEKNDFGASSSLQGYAAHYCTLPTLVDPTYMACSFILSGLRVFDISDLVHPQEIAYYNAPQTPTATYDANTMLGGAYAMSAPTYVPERREIWYSDGNLGFSVVRLSAAAVRSTQAAVVDATPAAAPAAAPPASPVAALPALAATGLHAWPWGLGGLALAVGLGLRRRSRA